MKKMFQYYIGGIRQSIPSGYVSLDGFIDAIKNPKQKTLNLLDEIKEASLNNDKELKNKLKEKLPFFTPAVIVKDGKSRRYENIDRFTGLAQIDFDGFDSVDQATDCKHWLFENSKQIKCAYLSPSKLGVKALMRVSVCKDVNEFQDHYRAITSFFKVECHVPHFDVAPQNAILPLYYSYDKDVLIRENALVWTKRIHKKKYVVKDSNIVYDCSSPLGKSLINKFIDRVEKITDNGHPQFRSACLMLGSLVGSGFLTQNDAEDLASKSIKSNSYLSDAHSHSTYNKTALWAIERSKNNPYKP